VKKHPVQTISRKGLDLSDGIIGNSDKIKNPQRPYARLIETYFNEKIWSELYGDIENSTKVDITY
jgi:hypothetical protein